MLDTSGDNTGMVLLFLQSACLSRSISEEAGASQGAGGGEGCHNQDIQGRLIPADHRDIPDYMASGSAYKTGGRMKAGMFRMMVFVFPSHCYM